MHRKKMHFVFWAVVSFWAFVWSASAHATIDATADKVALRTSCTVGGTALNDCFTSWWTLSGWIQNTRRPNASSPLEVDIGPGTFGPNLGAGAVSLYITCNPSAGYTGYISFVGSGSNESILTGQGGSSFSPLNVSSCTDLNFSNLQISNPNSGIAGYGAIEWSGGGISHWYDVQVIGNGRAWYEPTCGATPGMHYWYSSQLTATAAFSVGDTYDSKCDDSFFFGSQITLSVPSSSYGVNGGAAIEAHGSGMISMYGSHLRVFDDVAGSPAAAVWADTGGIIHIHGTGIEMLSDDGANLPVLNATSGGVIDATASSYSLSSTGGISRVDNYGGTGTILAPYLWPESATPPSVGSVTGADQVVITSTADGHPHLLIYDSTCSGSWYDTDLRACY